MHTLTEVENAFNHNEEGWLGILKLMIAKNVFQIACPICLGERCVYCQADGAVRMTEVARRAEMDARPEKRFFSLQHLRNSVIR